MGAKCLHQETAGQRQNRLQKYIRDEPHVILDIDAWLFHRFSEPTVSLLQCSSHVAQEEAGANDTFLHLNSFLAHSKSNSNNFVCCCTQKAHSLTAAADA